MTVSAGSRVANFPFEDARGFRRWVDLCEAGGVDSIWQSDRLIGADPNLECMSAMAWLAGRHQATEVRHERGEPRLRHPVLTAKTCATIDVLSEGRLLPAFGIGSALSRDYTATGTPTQGRGGRMDESLEIISQAVVAKSTSRSAAATFNSTARAFRRTRCRSHCRYGWAVPLPPQSNGPRAGAPAGRPASKPRPRLRR